MKESERTYDEMFALLRDTPPATSLTAQEIQSLLDDRSPLPAPEAPRFAPAAVTRHVLVAAALAVIAAGIWMLAPDNDPVAENIPAPATVSPGRAQAHPVIPAPQQTTRPVPEAIAAENRRAAGDGTGARQAVRTTSPIPSTDAAGGNEGTTHESLAIRDIAGKDSPLDAMKKQPEIATVPMLELNPKELEALGVVVMDGEIRTFGEEYYSLDSEQERALFAQMGIDTAQRTGIVRIPLVIDTKGMSTRKYPWMRMETYSRIAPIIALNTYAGTKQGSMVTLNSFKHSPIMDSAKRSVASIASVLTMALTSSNVDSMMHDGGQANLARVLVPVHVRLGGESVDGAMRHHSADIILWYYPTPEFAAALPARYRISLQKELNAIADVVECNLPPGEACQRMTGEPSLLNYCKRTSGALRGLNVSPNPAYDEVTVHYMLESPRKIEAALYGIHGEYVRDLVPAITADAGMHTAKIQLGSVTSGAYVVVLRSEQGEQVSERLIVQ